jgi:alcohol dehydrogenase class IV
VLFGAGRVHDLRLVLERMGRRRPVVLCSWRRERSAEFRHLAAGLGVTPRAFTGAQPHLPRQVVEAAWETVREAEADVVVSFGGGSTIDLGKAVAFVARHGPQALDEGRFAAVVEEPPVAHVAIPTAYSGAEATARLAFSEGPEPREVVGPGLRPTLVVADPTLTLSLGPRPTAATGFTALGHCLEGLYGEARGESTAGLAERAAGELRLDLPVADRAGSDERARTRLLAASYVAGVVIDRAGGALLQGLCDGLGSRTGIAHGVAAAILLPHVMRFDREDARPAHVRFARAIQADGPEEAPATVEELARALRVPRTLRESGVFRQDLEPVATWAAERSPQARRHPRPVSAEDALAVLEAAW